jgi:hypothetical protein
MEPFWSGFRFADFQSAKQQAVSLRYVRGRERGDSVAGMRREGKARLFTRTEVRAPGRDVN